jgi:hypothetical protein
LLTRKGSILSEPPQKFVDLFTRAMARIDIDPGAGE